MITQESEGHKKNESKKKEKGNKNNKPPMNGTEAAKPTASTEQVEKLKAEITTQGDKVRSLKTSGAAKVCLSINPISPGIHIEILQTDLHTFP